jgi:hypothetical protein
MSGAHALITAKFATPENKIQSEFRERNRVASNYRGPVYVVEDIYVPCALCRAPVDPVTRIPIGRIYFHPQCVRCAVCGRAAGSSVFVEAEGQPVCQMCNQKGFRPGKLQTSQFSTEHAWDVDAARTLMHGSRTPASAFTHRQLEWQMRQRNVAVGDTNIRLLDERFGDDPSQKVAFINNPAGVASRISAREKDRATLATPARRLLLPSLTPKTAMGVGNAIANTQHV